MCTDHCMHAKCVLTQFRTSQGLGLVPSWGGNPPTGCRVVSLAFRNRCFSSPCCGRSFGVGSELRLVSSTQHGRPSSVRLGAVIVRLSQASLLFSSSTSADLRKSGALFHSCFLLCLFSLLEAHLRPRPIDIGFLFPNRPLASKPSCDRLPSRFTNTAFHD